MGFPNIEVNKKMKMTKKGQVFDNLSGLGVGIAGLAITLVVTFLIISQGETQAEGIEGLDFSNATQCAQSSTCNATTTLAQAVDDIPGWVPLIIIASIGAILLGLVALFRR